MKRQKTKKVGQGWSSCNFLSLWVNRRFESLEKGLGGEFVERKSILQQALNRVAELLQRVCPERDEGLGWLQLRFEGNSGFEQSLCFCLFVWVSLILTSPSPFMATLAWPPVAIILPECSLKDSDSSAIYLYCHHKVLLGWLAGWSIPLGLWVGEQVVQMICT